MTSPLIFLVVIAISTWHGSASHYSTHLAHLTSFLQPETASTEMSGNPYTANFFLENQLRPGTTLRPYLAETSPDTQFIPMDHTNSDSLTLSTEKLPQILTQFSIQPDSTQAKTVDMTLHLCEKMVEEVRKDDGNGTMPQAYCATSEQSMIAFAALHIGNLSVEVEEEKTIWGLSTKVNGQTLSMSQQEYIITTGTKKMVGTSFVTCQALPFYEYKVHICRRTMKSAVYKVPMAGKDGCTVEATVVCSKDTSKWNPNHMSLLSLDVKPGKSTVCRILPQGDVVWTSPGECNYSDDGCSDL